MEAGKHYHIYTHANGFENLFKSDENYRYFLERYEHFIPAIADTLAYCLMPNHIHFLVLIKTELAIESFFQDLQGFKNLGGLDSGLVRGLEIEKRISQQFSNLFNSYAQSFNKMYDRKGSLFIHTFKRKEITTDSYLTNTIHYIHANPVHHGFVKEITDWPWSSYHLILSDAPGWIQQEEVIQWFGNREEFIKYHQQPIDLRTQSDMDF